MELYVPSNRNSWGPPAEEDLTASDNPMCKWSNLPKYVSYSRSDRIYGRSADFTSGGGGKTYGYGYGNGNTNLARKSGEDSVETFQLVDSTRAPKKFIAPAKKRSQQQSRLRQINARSRASAEQQGKDRYNQVRSVVCSV